MWIFCELFYFFSSLNKSISPINLWISQKIITSCLLWSIDQKFHQKYMLSFIIPSFDMCMNLDFPVDSSLSARILVSPNKHHLNICCPTTPPTSGPLWTPILIFNISSLKWRIIKLSILSRTATANEQIWNSFLQEFVKNKETKPRRHDEDFHEERH